MSRNQFVRNTLSAVQLQVQPNGSNSDFDSSSVRHGSDQAGTTPRRTKRSDSITSWSSITRDGILSLTASIPSATNGTKHANGSSSSIPTSINEPKSPETGGVTLYDRNWENEMETLLKV
jgi:PH and SEC7 domain-containing protein